MISKEAKGEFLVREGYVHVVNGEVMLSSKACAMLTGTTEAEWNDLVDSRIGDQAQIPAAFVRDIRRGSREVMAKLGTDDPFEVLYRLAVVPSE